MDGGWVQPGWLHRQQDGLWLDPAGFAFRGVPPTLPEARAESPSPPIQGLPCRPDQVVALQGKESRAWWITDLGEFPAGLYASQAAGLHPDLVPAGRGTYVNRQRLRRILNERKRFRLVMDNDLEFTLAYGTHKRLAEALGLPHLYGLEPCQEAFYRERIRAYSYDLFRASQQLLHRDFSEARQLIANALWQTVLEREAELEKEYNEDYRGYWYELKPALFRAAFLQRTRLDNDRMWALFQELVGTLVGADRLFTFQELGFTDARPDLRCIGSRRPDILLVAEKASLKRYVHMAQAEFGCSTLIVGGLPSLLSSEYCARALQQAGVQEVTPLAFMDYDPSGYIAARSLVSHLRRFGLGCSEPRFVVTPQCFSQTELEEYSLPIPAKTPHIRGKLKVWMGETGGINGLPRGIAADLLRPFERLAARIHQLLQAER